MESIVLTEYRIPAYPRKEEVRAKPSLLRKSVYKRWQKLYDLGISGMLVTGLSLSGCDKKPATNTTTQGIEAAPNQNSNSSKTNTVSPTKLAALVAPIFEHGEGRGSTGCIAVAPPAFLSEDEALVIIKEELKKNGIECNKKNIISNEVAIKPHGSGLLGAIGIGKNKAKPLEIDLQDSDKDINIEFVSRSDYFKFGGEKSNSTAQGFDMKKVVTQVRKKIQSDVKNGIYGVFYDPIIRYDIRSIKTKDPNSFVEQRENMRKEAFESGKEALRQQVNDFAKWLKEQGVIK
ncbi:MAG: hypothetical protein JW787_07135 [Sedimentisphaerales bacterium]|nr:hypothetical protein [Sedimentisphaerales bacterium]